MKWEDSWMSLLDWSTMKQTFELLSKDKQKLVLEGGYWSLGKGKFEVNIEGSEKEKEFEDLEEETIREKKTGRHYKGKYVGRGKYKGTRARD